MVKITAMCCYILLFFFPFLFSTLAFILLHFIKSILLLSMRMRFNDVLRHARRENT